MTTDKTVVTRFARDTVEDLVELRDLIEAGKSVLLLGRPGVGKTTVRYFKNGERKRMLAANFPVLRRLHTETFVLDVRQPLDEVAPIPGFHVERIDSTTLEVSVTRDKGLNALFIALAERGIDVLSLRNKQNRLERLFIDMVRGGLDTGEGKA